MLENLFAIDAFAEGGGDSSRDRGRTVRPAGEARRGQESMSAYYRRLGTTMLGSGSRPRSIRAARGARPVSLYRGVGLRGANRRFRRY